MRRRGVYSQSIARNTGGKAINRFLCQNRRGKRPNKGCKGCRGGKKIKRQSGQQGRAYLVQ